MFTKGQNVAIACEQYGEADKTTLLQFIGGRTGSYVQDYLCEKGIHQVTGQLIILRFSFC